VEADDAAAADLPEPLRSWYGGTLRFTEPVLVANFVTTIDGVVAIGSSWAYCGLSPTPCSSGPEHCVVHPTPYGPPSMPTPPGGPAFAHLRQRRDRPPTPQLAVMTASGTIDVDHPALTLVHWCSPPRWRQDAAPSATEQLRSRCAARHQRGQPPAMLCTCWPSVATGSFCPRPATRLRIIAGRRPRRRTVPHTSPTARRPYTRLATPRAGRGHRSPARHPPPRTTGQPAP
jgi:hypothetical protein